MRMNPLETAMNARHAAKQIRQRQLHVCLVGAADSDAQGQARVFRDVVESIR
jgi:hypothetical protein